MRTAGKTLQMIGLVLAPIALFHGIEGGSAQGVAQRELMILAAAGAIFLLGRWLEGRAAA